MLKKAYLEITNECNLACTFCHGTKRAVRYLTLEEFTRAASELRKHSDYIYFHLMGEPLLHPLLGEFLDIAEELGFRVVITTNGTLLSERGDILLSSAALHKVSISLHAYEANCLDMSLSKYLDSCFDFCRRASERSVISVMRLWNIGGEDSENGAILSQMREFFGGEWQAVRKGYRVAERVFLEWGDKFDWPDEDAEICSDCHSCYGLRDQVGVLSDGTVVPCCLDADGVIALGNIFEESLSDILAKPRAVALRRSFETRRIKEPLCLRCGFATQRVK
ncbi:MAG: radical SAM protein [Clostridia bacterium]|nr:radical SAM protein [Clostridia bacterium]